MSRLSRAERLQILQVVEEQSVVLEWKLLPSREALWSGEEQQASQLYLPQWISATVHINNPQISYTTKVIVPTLVLELDPEVAQASMFALLAKTNTALAHAALHFHIRQGWAN